MDSPCLPAASVDRWDALIRTGKSALPQPLPLTLGSDVSGMVESMGPGVVNLRPRDEVYGVTNAQFTGAYVEYALDTATTVAPKPTTLDHVQAGSVPVVATTAWQMLFDYAQVSAGQTVLDTVGGATQMRSYGVLNTGGILVSSVSEPNQAQALHYGVRARFFLVQVTTEGLNCLTALLSAGTLKTAMGEILSLEQARLTHEMLEGKPHQCAKILLEVAD